jgi:transposase-like protein
MPTTITSDGAPGLEKAIGACFPASIRIRCWLHRAANLRAKLPDESASEVMADLFAVRDAPTLDAARAAADRLSNTYRRTFPAAIACFEDDLDALLAIHRVPVRHRIRVRTTAERSFVEERRRTKVIGQFSNERSAMKLVFATMIRAADCWCPSVNQCPRTSPAQTAADRTRARSAPRHQRTQESPTQKRRRMINQPADLQDAQDLTFNARPCHDSLRRVFRQLYGLPVAV